MKNDQNKPENAIDPQSIVIDPEFAFPLPSLRKRNLADSKSIF